MKLSRKNLALLAGVAGAVAIYLANAIAGGAPLLVIVGGAVAAAAGYIQAHEAA